MEEATFEIFQTDCSNIGFEDGNFEHNTFVQHAVDSGEMRKKNGFDINGKAGGVFDENNPPPGKFAAGFLKGNVGIIWKEKTEKSDGHGADAENTTKDKEGVCEQCGYSQWGITHNAESMECPREGPPHQKGNIPLLTDNYENRDNDGGTENRAENENEKEDKEGVGYCERCGYSLYHYADKECPRGGPRHNVWKGHPPPSFADINR